MQPSPHRNLILWLIAVGIALPLLWYALAVGRAPSIDPADARREVLAGSALLVCVEEPQSCELDVPSLHWSLATLLQTHSPSDLPAIARNRPLRVICPGGVSSAIATRHLLQIGIPDVRNVSGGIQQWLTAPTALRPKPASVPAFHSSPLAEQWAVVGAFFGVKTLYSLMAAWIIALLWRQREGDLVALRWSMLFFFTGEAVCFVNVMAFHDLSIGLEHAHSVGMVLSLAFAAYALMEGLDRRLIQFSGTGRCAATTLCRTCVRQSPNPQSCGLRRAFILLTAGALILALMPLCSELRDTAYNTRVLGAWHAYRHPLLAQAYELRYLPGAAIVLLIATLAALHFRERQEIDLAKILFAAGLGALGFSLLRMVLVASYVYNQVWFAVWEETTELLYIGLILGILLLFRPGLLRSVVRPSDANLSPERACVAPPGLVS